jgi:NADPH2:quinone reductase
MVGGEYLPRNIAAAARGAHIVLLASLSGAASRVNAGQLVFKWLTVSGSTLRPQPPAVKAEIAQSLRQTVWPGLADGRIRPPRLRRLPLEQAAAAHAEMERRAHFGKLLLITGFGRGLGEGDRGQFD